MTLLETIGNLGTLDPAGTIYAAKPWTVGSEAMVVAEPTGDEGKAIPEINGLKYFLEVQIAAEFLEELSSTRESQIPLEAACARLIQYAVMDA